MKMFNDLMQISFNKESIWNGKPSEGFGIFVMFQQYVYGAITQWQRIQSSKDALSNDGVIDTPNIMRNLFLDIHFYFICAGKIQELVEQLTELEGDEILGELKNSRRESFEPYNDVRNHLDHIENSLTGKYMADFTSIGGDRFSFGGKNLDVGSSSLKLLTDVYDDVVRILLMRVK